MRPAVQPRGTERLPMCNARRRNLETFKRLFQGFINEYGNDAGEKIIDHLVNHDIGGRRVWVPAPGPDPLSRCGQNFRKLWRDTCTKFGRESGRAIMRKIIVEFGDQRICFPDHEARYRAERDTKIRNLFNGTNIQELALRFGLHRAHIYQILDSDD